MITRVDLLNDGEAVRIDWDGGSARFHAIWLRDNAPDEETRDPGNGQRLITLADIPADTRIAEVQAVDGGVEVRFSPEEKVVTFPADWLRDNAYDREDGSTGPWLPAGIETWDSGLSVPAASFDELLHRGDALRDWLGAVHRYGFAKVTGGPAESGALLQLVDLFGSCARPTTVAGSRCARR